MTTARQVRTRRPPGAWRRFATAAVVSAGLFVGVPAVLAACAVAALDRVNPLPAIGGVDEIRAYVERGLTTTEILAIAVRMLLVVGWVLWATLVLSTIGAIAEARSGTRGRWPRVPVFHALSHWIAAGLTAISALSPNHVTAGTTATRLPFTISAGPTAAMTAAVPVERPVPPGAVRVLPGESAETFAQRTLGNADRWPEIWELNRLRPVGPGGEIWSAAWRLSAGWDLVVPGATAPPTASPEPDPPPSASPAASPARHDVVAGDSYWAIAEQRLGPGARAADVMALTEALVADNAPDLGYADPAMLHPGDVVTIDPELFGGSSGPPILPDPAPSDVSDPAPTDSYEVQSGDSYWAIAERRALELHGPEGARANVVYDLMLELIDLNAPRLGHDTPELLQPGDVVWFADPPQATPPTVPTADEVAAALAATAAVLEEAGATLAPSGPVGGASVGTIGPIGEAATAVAATAAATSEALARTEPAAPESAAAGTSSTTTTTRPGEPAPPADGGEVAEDGRSAPLIGPGEAALAATGVVLLLAARRRARLRAAEPPARVPLPGPRAAATERSMRGVSDAERLLRVDIAVRAAAADLAASGHRIVGLRSSPDGTVDLRLTGPAPLPPPWVGGHDRWVLDGGVAVEDLAPAARTVGAPCLALTPIGVDEFGWDVLADLEAVRLLSIDAEPSVADDVVRGIATAIASSVFAEVVHLVGVGVGERAFLDHRLAHHVDTLDEAFELAGTLVGAAPAPRSTFELRARRTGGETWEPAVVVVGSASAAELPAPAILAAAEQRGVAVVIAGAVDGAPWLLRPAGEHWTLSALDIRLRPVGLSVEAADDIADVLDVAPLLPVDFSPPAGHALLTPAPSAPGRDLAEGLAAADGAAGVQPLGLGLDLGLGLGLDLDLDLDLGADITTSGNGWTSSANGGGPLLVHHPSAASNGNGHRPTTAAVVSDAATGDGADDAGDAEAPAWQLMVRLLGPIDVVDRDGTAAHFERSKSLELASWLITHRERSTRQAARTALWDLDVRDTTFANVVSETRRTLARHVEPPEGDEWLRRTLTDELSVHDGVVSDADVLRWHLAAARGREPHDALRTLRPAVDVVRGMPFEATAYLWPDAEGITSSLMLLATSATATFGELALAAGDLDGVFWATGLGLNVVAGQESLIALRMRAHAEQGDRSGVRTEWEAYLRALGADPWSDGEPASKLVELRAQLLGR